MVQGISGRPQRQDPLERALMQRIRRLHVAERRSLGQDVETQTELLLFRGDALVRKLIPFLRDGRIDLPTFNRFQFEIEARSLVVLNDAPKLRGVIKKTFGVVSGSDIPKKERRAVALLFVNPRARTLYFIPGTRSADILFCNVSERTKEVLRGALKGEAEYVANEKVEAAIYPDKYAPSSVAGMEAPKIYAGFYDGIIKSETVVLAFRTRLLTAFQFNQSNPVFQAMIRIAADFGVDFTESLLQQLNEREHLPVSEGMAKALAAIGNISDASLIALIQQSLQAGITSAKVVNHASLAQELRDALAAYNTRLTQIA